MLSLSVRSVAKVGYADDCLELPLEATVDDLIKIASKAVDEDGGCRGVVVDGCVGFVTTSRRTDDDEDDYDYDDNRPSPRSPSGLAEKLSTELLRPGNSLSSYGINATTAAEISLYPVFEDVHKQPTVFKSDLEEMGFGEHIYKYVKVNAEPKELAQARHIFSGPMLKWLAKGSEAPGSSQTLALSMEDDFECAPKPIVTVNISKESGELVATCTNLAGDALCTVKLPYDEIVGQLCSALCKQLEWTSITLWNGSETVPEGSPLSSYSMLTGEQNMVMDHVQGSYHSYDFNLRPAGYSASSTSFSNMLVLESGRACLQYHFKGDYKRAEELQKLVMMDARWCIERCGDNHVVRITGQASLSRYWAHERSGYDESGHFNNFKCYASVTVPVEQLEQGQREERLSNSSPGSGWTCGSEEYRCSYFLPMSLLEALRAKSEPPALQLQAHLNGSVSPDYPQSLIAGGVRNYGYGELVPRLSSEAFEVIKHFREQLAGKGRTSIEEIVKLQLTGPKLRASGDGDA